MMTFRLSRLFPLVLPVSLENILRPLALCSSDIEAFSFSASLGLYFFCWNLFDHCSELLLVFCNTLLGVVPFVMFLGPVRLSPSLSFQEVLRGVRASLVRFLLCPLHPFFFFLSSFMHSHRSESFLCFTYRG